MATTRATPVGLAAETLEPLELLLFSAIGMTSVALAEASAADLTLVQWRALVVIGRSEGLRVGDLAARIGMSLPSTSRLIGRLERRNYVATEQDPADRRATLVGLSQEGRRVRKAVIDHRRRLMTEALSLRRGRVPTDLRGGLQALAEAFDRYE